MKKLLGVTLTVLLISSAALADAGTEDLKADPDYEETNWEVSASVAYDTGDFGTDTTTDTVYVPVTLRRFFDIGDIAVTVPYIYQQSSSRVTAVGGTPVRTSSAAADSERSAHGIGDILLSGRAYLANEEDFFINLYPVSEIKFPSADDDEGLGTGEFDYTIGAELSRSAWHFITIFADIYYTFIGAPDDLDLDDELMFSAGVGFDILESAYVSVAYVEATALVDDEDNPRSVITGFSYDINNTIGVFSDFSAGLSDGSPDFGAAAGMKAVF